MKLIKNCITHYLDDTEIMYPVGSYMLRNLPIIQNMAKVVASLPYEDFVLCCRGSSGAIIAGIIASIVLPTKNRCVISYFKKEGEQSHCSGRAAVYDNDFIIFVDDFITSGKTYNTVEKELKTYYGRKFDGICISGAYPEFLISNSLKVVICRDLTL